MKITIEKTETVKTEVEIKLPYYRKTNCHYLKVYSETKCLQVCQLEGYMGIEQARIGLAFGKGTVDSTEEEFLAKWDEVYYLLLRL